MAETSILKFKVEMEATAFQQVTQQIRALKTEVEGLAKALASIRLPGGGGSGLLGGISTGKPISGLPSSTGGTSGAQTPGQAVGGILTSGLVADKNLFRTITEGSKEALRAMKDALKQSAQEQEQIIKRLKGEIDALSKSYNSLSNTGGLGGNMQAADLEAMLTKGKQLSAAQKNLAATNAAAEGGGGGGIWGMAKNALGGGGLAAFGVAGAVVGAGIYAYDKVANSYYDTRDANLKWGLNKAVMNMQSAGDIGASLGGLGMQMRGGDIAGARVFKGLMGRGDVQRILSESSESSRRLLALSQSGQRATVGQYMSAKGGELSAELVKAIDSGDAESIQKLAFKEAMLSAKPEAARQVKQMVDDGKNLNVLATSRFNNFYSRAEGNASVMRALGAGETDRHGVWHDVAQRNEQAAREAGLTGEERAGFVQEAGLTIGRGNRYKGVGLLKRRFGGYENVLDMFNIGQQYGNGNDLVNVIGGKGGAAGKGGIDAKAAVMMGALVKQQMENSTIGMSGIELAQGLGGVIGMAGKDIGGQFRLANQLKSGLSTETARMAGQLDPLNAAINAYAGAGAFGGDFYSMDMMTRMSSGEMSSILRGGPMSERLTDMGITREQVQKYAASQDQFALSRYMDTGRGTQLDTVVREAREAGGTMEYIRKQTKGMSGEDLRTKYLNVTRQLGEAEGLSLGMGSEQAISAVRARSASIVDPVTGKGIWDPFGKGRTKDVYKQKGVEAGKTADFLESGAGQDGLKTTNDLTTLGEGIGAVSTAFINGINLANEQLDLFAEKLSKITGKAIPKHHEPPPPPAAVTPKSKSYGDSVSDAHKGSAGQKF